ncbi:MAG: hypothetical protein IH614_16115 [Desulfuromonadales bacterium]|nr:hypothetical protein [Desulfuromonadales bacterium]
MSGNEILSPKTVISFMANNRIRTVGHLESFHISRAREELGATFILLGTISQLKERPTPSMGMTLQLVRTSDGRTVWSYVGHFSTADGRRPLGIGEPKTVTDLYPFFLDDIVSQWPWETINEMQRATAINIDSIVLQPAHLRPGVEVHAKVRLRNDWPADRSPRVFFKADEQIHAATIGEDSRTYEASWIAGEKDGRFPVNLLLEWPIYGRSETALLGSYLVDGTPPLLELELRGTSQHAEVPVFRKELVIVPRLLVRKPLARWRLAFSNQTGELVGADEGAGNLPGIFAWQGRGNTEVPVLDGEYQVLLEVWDEAGNKASASRRVEMNRSAPAVAMALEKNGQEVVVDLENQGKVPLAFWRLEMWTTEGRIIKMAEGEELPGQIGIELPEGGNDADLQGYLMLRDVLGNQSKRDMNELFLQAGKKQPEKKREEAVPKSETWVDEF